MYVLHTYYIVNVTLVSWAIAAFRTVSHRLGHWQEVIEWVDEEKDKEAFGSCWQQFHSYGIWHEMLREVMASLLHSRELCLSSYIRPSKTAPILDYYLE